MGARKLFLFLLLVFIPEIVKAQSATPGFVSESGKNSTLAVALGTSDGGGFIPTSTCASFAYCLPFAENTLAGNLGIAAFEYANGTAVTSTVTDDKSNAWTCIGSSAASSDNRLNLCYTPNLTEGTHKVTIGFAGTAVTQVQANVAQFNNIATSTPLRTSSAVVGTSSTTMTGPALTTTANDLVYAMFCRTGSPLEMTSGSFTPGSGFTFGLTKYQDGCATEWQVSAGGTVTPTMTQGSASTYIVFAAAFIASASSAGTAPTGPYLRAVYPGVHNPISRRFDQVSVSQQPWGFVGDDRSWSCGLSWQQHYRFRIEYLDAGWPVSR